MPPYVRRLCEWIHWRCADADTHTDSTPHKYMHRNCYKIIIFLKQSNKYQMIYIILEHFAQRSIHNIQPRRILYQHGPAATQSDPAVRSFNVLSARRRIMCGASWNEMPKFATQMLFLETIAQSIGEDCILNRLCCVCLCSVHYNFRMKYINLELYRKRLSLSP